MRLVFVLALLYVAVAELADAAASKAVTFCGFNSHQRHHITPPEVIPA